MAKKPLKDTKLGNWFRDKAPDLLDVVGHVVPGGEVLQSLSRLIDSADVSEQDKVQAKALLFELESDDRKDARSREVQFVRSMKRRDWMQVVVGAIGLLTFVVMIAWAMIGIEEREVFFHVLGVSEGILGSIVGYYFGSSVKEGK